MGSKAFLTSDLHFGHKAMAGGFRDYPDIETHNIDIMERINAVVSKKDTLWILGDVIWSAADIAWINCLNSGNIKIVLGNHDPEASIFIDNGYKCYGALKKYGFWLTHIPIHPQEMRDLNNIHGHIHNPDKGLKDGRYFNVNWDFHHRPLEINEIRSMQKLRGSTYD